MSDSNELGHQLEQSVRAVEVLILETDPQLRGRPYRISSRVVRSDDGVKHEIDLLVELVGPYGYDARFIFECKNWSTPVGKNEIIILAEKIDVFQAQRAFIVAPRLTADALARVAKDPRITVVEAERVSPSTFGPLSDFHYLLTGVPCVDFFVGIASGGIQQPEKLPGNMEFVENGNPVNIRDLVREHVHDLSKHALNNFPSGTVPEGEYHPEATGRVEFQPGHLYCNGLPVGLLDLRVSVPATVIRPVATCCFDLKGRGRTITFSGFEKDGTHMKELIISTKPDAPTPQ